MSFDAFIQESYKRLLLRDPESVTEAGLTEFYGTSNDRLTDVSDAYIHETQALERSIYDLLMAYDRAQLTPEQQLTADVYAWYLDDRIRGQAFMYDDYPVNQMIYSVDLDLAQFFSDVHPVTNKQDAQDYITRLSQVDTKFAQVLDGLQRREQLGITLPRFLIPWVLQDLRSISNSHARSTPFYSAFQGKVRQLSGLSDQEKQALLDEAETEINDSVLPAFQSLVVYFQHLQTVATDDAGVWKFSNGEDYYNYLLTHYTTTDLTADQIHTLGQQELERVHAEMRLIFDQLGYPQDENLSQLFGRVAQDSGVYRNQEIVSAAESLIEDASQRISGVFDLRPKADVIVIGGTSGGYYLPAAVDGSRPGIFYAIAVGTQPRFTLPTLVYHETIPGHHFQISIAQELDLPFFRCGTDFTAYIEGWALYAERLVSELGFYDDDPYGDLGRLQAEAFRAARLVVDTGIHAKGWTYEQAVEYMLENTGKSRDSIEYEVARYIVLPGQATAYEIGFLKILGLRQRAMDALGDQFDLKEFHNVVLGEGALPLPILEQVVDAYIQEKLSK
jgi:uncharacterized protein (DUF885 family)